MSEFILGVDLDNVCADYTAGFRKFVSAELDIDPTELGPITSWGHKEWGIDDEQFKELHSKAVSNGLHRDLPLVEGAADALWRLSDAGIWIRVITHRLYTNWSHEKAVSDTVAWLDKHRIPYRDLCFLGAKPQVEADIYIDDAPHNVAGLREAGNLVITFDQPYNRDLEGLRAKNWTEAEEIILAEAAKKQGVQAQLPGIDPGADRLDRKKSSS